jgi:hypothetical protein
VGTSQGNLSKIEQGKVQPTADVLVRLLWASAKCEDPGVREEFRKFFCLF